MGLGAVVGIASAGASIVSGSQERKAAARSADMQTAAAERARIGTERAGKASRNLTWKMYQQSRKDIRPWLTAGTIGLKELGKRVAEGPGEFKESPGYKFRLAEGENAILRNAARMGNVASGQTLRDLQTFAQDYASTEYDKFLGRYYESLRPIQSLAGVGQTVASDLGSAGRSTALNIGNIMTGTAASSGKLGMIGAQAQGEGYARQADITSGIFQGTLDTLGSVLGDI